MPILSRARNWLARRIFRHAGVPSQPEVRPEVLDRSGARWWKSVLQEEVQHLLSVWYPRCVDEQHGGFLCHFDNNWKLTGPNFKMLEFQARLTRVAATAAMYPGFGRYNEYARHGFEYLRDVLWDTEYGGFYRMLDRQGVPQEASTKHAHGTSYAINACVKYYESSGHRPSLEFAKQAFDWIDSAVHDEVNGGYFGFSSRDGKRISSIKDCPIPGAMRDSISTPIGFKDLNTSMDMLSAIADLVKALPGGVPEERMRELFFILRDKLIVPPGAIHFCFNPDWTPIPEFNRYGLAVNAFNILSKSASVMSIQDDWTTQTKLRSLVDQLMKYGWDSHIGGFQFGGSTFGVYGTEDFDIGYQKKYWWVQAEGLRALLRLASKYPNEELNYFQRFAQLWQYIDEYLIDKENGGWRWIGRDHPCAERCLAKSTEWKDPSHEVLSLLECLDILDAIA